jgi:peptide deformylase
MACLEILKYPDKRLIRVAYPIENVDGRIQKLILDMAETMYHAPGVGLAAPQVGEDCRILIHDVETKEKRGSYQVLINPLIVEREGEQVTEEGCLSVVDYRANVRRAARICVRAIDWHGKPVEREYENLLAIVVQHEIDHLDGILFIDRISKLKKSLYTKRLMKQLKKSADDY